MKLVLSGTVEGYSSRVDGSLKVVFSTQEIESDTVGKVHGLVNKFCKVLVSDTNITNIEENLIDAETLPSVGKNKTKSQRLRAVFYRLWEQDKTGLDFENYYQSKMESVIEFYKTKLQ